MLRRIERGEGTRWQAYGRRNGKKVYIGTYASKKEATHHEADFRVTQEKIERGDLPPEILSTRTLQEAVDAWLADLLKRNARCEETYRWSMKALILPRIGSKALVWFTKRRVIEWRDSFGTEYAATTINAALGCLSAAFGEFVDRDWIAANPCTGVAKLEVKDRSYGWIKTVPEIERLLRACNPHTRDMVAFAIGTGTRIDEMLHLQWDDVDLERRLLTIQRGRKGTPKRGMRHVPILDSVLPVLQARALKRDGNALVFPAVPSGRVRTKQTVTKSFKRSLKRAELDTSTRWHDLRHTFASHWVLNGGDIFRLSKILGHSSVLITQRTYAHLAPEAWSQDYHRIAFRLPSEGKVVAFKNGAS